MLQKPKKLAKLLQQNSAEKGQSNLQWISTPFTTERQSILNPSHAPDCPETRNLSKLLVSLQPIPRLKTSKFSVSHFNVFFFFFLFSCKNMFQSDTHHKGLNLQIHLSFFTSLPYLAKHLAAADLTRMSSSSSKSSTTLLIRSSCKLVFCQNNKYN